MGEWNEHDGIGPGMRALLGRVSDREREAHAAWRRGEPHPDDVPQMTETTVPKKRVYTGNRKARRAKARGNAFLPGGMGGDPCPSQTVEAVPGMNPK